MAMITQRFLAALVVGGMLCGPAHANGWEHGAVPLSALLSALEFDDPGIREQAAHSLGFRGQVEGVGPLRARLALPEEVPKVRRAIYEALGRIGSLEAIPDLTACAANEETDPIRATCIVALGEIGSAAGLDAILLGVDGAPLLRAAAFNALAGFPQDRAIATLAKGAMQGAASSRYRAIRALGRTGTGPAVDILLAALDQAVREKDLMVIVLALADAASPRAVAPLERLLGAGDASPRLKAGIALALGASRNGTALLALTKMLDDPVSAVRYVAVEALLSLGDPAAVSDILRLARREADQLAAVSADRWAEEAAVNIAALELQTRALQALERLDASVGYTAFKDAAAAQEVPRASADALAVAGAIYQRRRIGLFGMGYAGPDDRADAAAYLAGPNGLGDPDPRLRANAVRSLGVLGDVTSADAVRPMLADEAMEVRMTAARVAGLLRDVDAVLALITLLSDKHVHVREEAVRALGYIGDVRAAPALKEMKVEERSEIVRAAATYALTLLGY